MSNHPFNILHFYRYVFFKKKFAFRIEIIANFAIQSLHGMKNCKRFTGILLLVLSLLSGRNGTVSYSVAKAAGGCATCDKCTAVRPCKETAGLLAETLVTGAPQAVRLPQQNSSNGNSYGKRNQAPAQAGTGCSAIGRNRQTAPFHPARQIHPTPYGIRWLQVFRI